MKFLFSLFILLILTQSIFAQKDAFTKRENNYVREGAGAYFPLVEVLPAGVKVKIVSEEDNWLKVNLENGKSGFLSQNSISDKKGKVDYSSKFANKWSNSKVSKTGLAGAIKGLTGKSDNTGKGDPEQLMKLLQNSISVSEYNSFVSNIKLEKSSNKGKVDLRKVDKDIPEYDPSYEEQQVGFGIASRLVKEGAYNNKEITKYVNLIARTLIANTKFYDWEFHVVVLDKKVVDGFAVPGGYVFITKGAIENCNDESELAAILAHEMGHIIRKHGLQEMTKRTGHIKMDDAFAELEDETGGWDEETQQVEDDMEDIIVSSYEHIVKDRLLAYETEADMIAAMLLAEAGYDPFAIARVHTRLAGQHNQSKDIFDNNYLAPNDLNTRCKLITDYTNKKFAKNNPGAICLTRFNRMKTKI